MPITSQIRLQQLTGSFGNAASKNSPGMIRTDSAPKILEAVGGVDLSGSLSAIASAIGRIHGRASFEAFDNAAGTFYQTIVPDSSARDIGSTTAEWGDIFIGDEKGVYLGAGQEHRILEGNTGLDIDSNESIDIGSTLGNTGAINIGAIAQAKTITIGADQSTKVDVNAIAIELDATTTVLADAGKNASDAIKLNASNAAGGVQIFGGTGNFDVDFTNAGDGSGDGNVTIDAGGLFSIDGAGASSNVTLTSDGDAQDLTVALAGANDSSLILTSAGTGADALQVTATAGGMDVTSALAMDITTSGGNSNITIDPNGSGTLTLGSDDNTKVDVNALAIELDAGGQGIVLDSLKTGLNSITIDAAGGFSIDGQHAASNISLVSDDDADDLTISLTGNTNSSILLSSTGTGVDAIGLTTTAGGISATIPTGQSISAGLAGNVELMISPAGGGGAATTGKLINELGTGKDSVALEAQKGYAAISGSLGVEVSGSDVVVATADSRVMSAGHMAWAIPGEFASFIAKPQFSTSTTLVGALNALATAAGGGFCGKAVITGSAVDKLQLSGSGMSGDSGFTNVIDLREATPANTDVFVNGQLLVSGTGASGGGGDYGVDYTDPGAINFQFNLQPDDVVLVKTTADQ